MGDTRRELLRALAPLDGPLGFASRSDQALLNLAGFDTLALRAIASARRLPLSRAEEASLDRIVHHVRAFAVPAAEERRRSLQAIVSELTDLRAGALQEQPAPEAPSRQRVRPLSEEGSLAPVAVEGETLRAPLSSLRRIGPAVAEKLAARGLHTLADALLYLPRRYEDRRAMSTIGDARAGKQAVIAARVVAFREKFARKRSYELEVEDDTGTLVARWFGFRPGASRGFVPGAAVVLSGEVRAGFRGRKEIVHPDLEMGEAATDEASFGRIIPIYTEVDGISARVYRRIARSAVEACVDAVEDFHPESFRQQQELVPLRDALAWVHFPPDDADYAKLARFASPAQRRLVFDELFFVQLGLALRRQGVKLETGIPFVADDRVLSGALERLPFAMTGAQRRALDEVARDVSRPVPMNRLLQGDVGSGKTAVALAAAMIAVENGYQAAVMAPTELLAEQHLRTFERLLGSDLFRKRPDLPPVHVTLLAAGRRPREHRRSLNEVASGTARIAVGTHALIQEGVEFQRLGLVIIDEQHRFGVMQRARLMEKGRRPHVLVMTATPIPRTLALTLYGDLDVSIIDELPPGRTPVTTKVFSGKTRVKAYDLVRKEVNAGRQAYVVLPLVEESEKLDLRAATEEAARLSREEFAGLRLGLVHGRMSAEERNAAMEEFRRGATQILVATTVIEVGVDVPNASVMLIEHAERFGLSQLHQLRGRVGRGTAKSWCLLVAESDGSAQARERLAAMARTANGFEIAEKDLEIRGPGEFLGTRQSGMPDLVVADLLRDQAILKQAREAAFELVEKDPRLRRPEHLGIARELRRRWADKLSIARIG